VITELKDKEELGSHILNMKCVTCNDNIYDAGYNKTYKQIG